MKVGQEWEKAHNDGPSSPPTRIRIVAIPSLDLGKKPKALVESDMGTHWGRRRYISLSALNNMPSGYRLTKEAP